MARDNLRVEQGRRYRALVEVTGMGLFAAPEFVRATLVGLGASNVDVQKVKPGRFVVTLTWRKESRKFSPPLGARVTEFQEVE